MMLAFLPFLKLLSVFNFIFLSFLYFRFVKSVIGYLEKNFSSVFKFFDYFEHAVGRMSWDGKGHKILCPYNACSCCFNVAFLWDTKSCASTMGISIVLMLPICRGTKFCALLCFWLK